MAINVNIELDDKGIQELLHDSGLMKKCSDIAARIQDKAGEGYEVEPYNGSKRGGYNVKPADVHHHFSNLKNNTLVKAMYEAKE